MMHSNQLIDAWLRGELAPEQRLAFEELRASDPDFRKHAKLARELEQSLKRSFGPRALERPGVSAVLEAIEARRQSASPAPSSSMVGIWLAAAAALMLLLAELASDPEPSPLKPLEPQTEMLGTLESAGSLPRFEGAERLEDGRLVPNMEGILCAATHFTERQALQQCSASELKDLRVSMGGAVGLSHAALGVLEGPIMASEWPGSMVFANRSSDGLSLLIAGQDGLNTCCLDVRAPHDSDMRVHTWRVGDTLWYEISRFEEPRLLSLVDSFSAVGP